jgi:GNAT acetyltransferase-like protein
MAELSVRPYRDADAREWDALIDRSCNGTFIQTRRYLSYHGDRFTDVSLVVEDGSGAMVAVLPAAVDPGDPSSVVSHPGITYGGLVHDGSVRGAEQLAVFDDLVAAYREMGFVSLDYRPVPHIYHRVPAGDDLYAMYRLEAARTCLLSAAIDLQAPPQEKKKRRESRAKAGRLGVHVVTGAHHLDALWPVLEAHLAGRHGATPVHTLAEMQWLAAAFPDNIECDAVLLGEELVGGVVLYKTPCVVRPQYAATTDRGKEVGAQDVGIGYGIAEARAAGVRWYDLGTSNEDDGRVLNPSLYRYKTFMGAGGVPFERYRVDLRRPSGS